MAALACSLVLSAKKEASRLLRGGSEGSTAVQVTGHHLTGGGRAENSLAREVLASLKNE